MTFTQWVLQEGRRIGPARYTLFCPACQKKRKHRALSVAFVWQNQPPGIHCFSSGCTPFQVAHALGLRWSDIEREMGTVQLPEEDYKQPSRAEVEAKIKKILDRSKPWVQGDTVDRYLANRGLSARSDELRSTKRIYYTPTDFYEGMVCPIRDVNGAIIAVHRTFLQGDHKAPVEDPKRSLGPAKGGAMQLFAPTDEVAICEGIETALAVREMMGWPVWAAAASLLPYVEFPREVKTVHICSDNDPDGLKMARRLAKRLMDEGRQVRIYKPQTEDTDFLDQMLERQASTAPHSVLASTSV